MTQGKDGKKSNNSEQVVEQDLPIDEEFVDFNDMGESGDPYYDDEDYDEDLEDDEPKVAKIPLKEISIDKIRPNQWNPNVQSVETFNKLSEDIDEDGFDEPPVLVGMWGPIPPMPEDEKAWKEFDWKLVTYKTPDGSDRDNPDWYRIISGQHRWQVLRNKGYSAVDSVVKDPDHWDEIKQKIKTVRRNLIKGRLDDAKFTDMVNEIMTAESIDIEILSDELGFEKFADFYKHYEEEQEERDRDISDLVQEADKELGQVDSLTIILNTLFQNYSETLPADFMHFTYKRKMHMMVMLNQEGKTTLDELAEYLREENGFNTEEDEGGESPIVSGETSILSINTFLSKAISGELEKRKAQARELSKAVKPEEDLDEVFQESLVEEG